MSALDPSALLSLLPTLLPTDSRRLSTPNDALAALVHTMMTALEFRLVAVDDDSLHQQTGSNILPLEWNSHAGNHTFRYKHSQSSLEFVVKVIKLSNRTVVNAITDQTDKVASLDVQTKDFTSQSFFPYDFSSTSPLVHGYISSARVLDFATSFKTQIVQKVLPGLGKDGYQDTSDASGQDLVPTLEPSRNRPQPAGLRQPLREPPYNAGHPFGQIGGFPRDANPLEIGRRDREPIITDPFASPFLGAPGTGGGMFIGPDDPILGGGWGGPARPQRGHGPWGGDGFLPPMGAPPGARFDPVGPFGAGPPTGPRLPPRRGEPDNDEFMPPGFGSDMII